MQCCFRRHSSFRFNNSSLLAVTTNWSALCKLWVLGGFDFNQREEVNQRTERASGLDRSGEVLCWKAAKKKESVRLRFVHRQTVSTLSAFALETHFDHVEICWNS